MLIKKVLLAMLLIVGLVFSPLVTNLNSDTANAANWGKTKTVTSYLSKAQIKKKIGNQTSIAAVTGPIASGLGSAAGGAVKTALGRGVLGATVSATIALVNAGAKKEKKKLQGYLKKIKAGKAKGIKIKQKYQYGYMNGYGYTWVRSGNPSFSLY